MNNANGMLRFHKMCEISNEKFRTDMFCLHSPSGLFEKNLQREPSVFFIKF